MKKHEELFFEVFHWLKETYNEHHFFTERDIVWTFQKKLIELIKLNNLPYKVISDYGLIKGSNRSKSVDIAIIDSKMDINELHKKVKLAIEFKYEPNKLRAGNDIPKQKCNDIPKQKFPVTSWNLINKDIDRIKNYKSNKKAVSSIFLLIDEGGRYLNRDINLISKWQQNSNGINFLLIIL